MRDYGLRLFPDVEIGQRVVVVSPSGIKTPGTIIKFTTRDVVIDAFPRLMFHRRSGGEVQNIRPINEAYRIIPDVGE